MLKKLLYFLGGCFVLLLLLLLLRVPILRGAAHYLISEDNLQKTEVAFVLSGGAADRGTEAARLFKEGYFPHIVCTGENVTQDFEAVGLDYPESQLTKIQMTRLGVPESAIELIVQGTSTKEEAAIIIDYCKRHQLKKIIIVSSDFHTRRIRRVLEEQFQEAGISLILQGAPSAQFDQENWWKDEYGLIAVNNEYIKLLYYWLKY